MEPRGPRVANETCSEIAPFSPAERESVWETAPRGNYWHPNEKRREFGMLPGIYEHRRLFIKPERVGQFSPQIRVVEASCQAETRVPWTQRGFGTD